MGIQPKALARYTKAVAVFLECVLLYFKGVAGSMEVLDVQAYEYFEYL